MWSFIVVAVVLDVRLISFIGKIELNLERSRDGGELSHFSSSHKGRPESDRKATGKVYYKGDKKSWLQSDRKVDYKREAKENKS